MKLLKTVWKYIWGEKQMLLSSTPKLSCIPWRRSRTVPLPRSPDPCHILPVPRTISCPRQTVRPPSPVICITKHKTGAQYLLSTLETSSSAFCKINNLSRSQIFSCPYGSVNCGGAWNDRFYPSMPLWCVVLKYCPDMLTCRRGNPPAAQPVSAPPH